MNIMSVIILCENVNVDAMVSVANFYLKELKTASLSLVIEVLSTAYAFEETKQRVKNKYSYL